MTFKDLTVENWLQPDPVSELFVQFDAPSQRVVPLTGRVWTAAILAVAITSEVPVPVRDLFAVARGAMAYGAFFYPLYTLAAEQLWRVADTAAVLRYTQLGGPPLPSGRVPVFARRIAWLTECGAIPEACRDRWEGFRELRNATSHPEFQSIFPPGNALTTLRAVSRAIDDLFA